MGAALNSDYQNQTRSLYRGSALWLRGLNCYTGHMDPIWAPVQVPIATQLAADPPKKGKENAPSPWVPASRMGEPVKVPGSWLQLAQPQPWWPSGSSRAGRRFVSF